MLVVGPQLSLAEAGGNPAFGFPTAFRIDTVFSGPRGHESQSVAESLCRTSQFANPFKSPTGSTAHLTPFHPLLLAALTIAFKKARPAVFGFTSGLTILVIPSPTLLAAAYLALLTLLPWTARNMLVLGSPIWGRDNLGLELDAANNDCAASKVVVNRHSGYFVSWQPNTDPAAAAAVEWISQNPARFTTLTAERIQLFWFPDIGLALITLLGFAGAALLFNQNRPAFWTLASRCVRALR